MKFITLCTMLIFSTCALAISDGVYIIKNKFSGKVAEVESASTSNNANIVQRTENGSGNQKWIITDLDGYYSIRAQHSNKAMLVGRTDTSDGGNVYQSSYWGRPYQQWNITAVNGYFSIINRNSNRALDLLNWDESDGANIGQWSYSGADAQLWSLEAENTNPNPNPVDPPSGPSEIDPYPSTGNTYHWPVTGNLGTHDPTIIKENNTWWVFQTGTGIYGKVSYNGGINWEPLPSVLPNSLWWWSRYVPAHSENDVWAPDVRQFNGKTYMYYSISTFGSNQSAIGLLSTDSIAGGNWTDEGLVVSTTTNDNHNAIDSDLVIDASGNPWLTYGSHWSGIKLVALNPNTMKPTGITYSIASRENADGQGIEASTIMHRDGYYYLFTSVGVCCQGVNSTYTIRYGRSSSVTGPYLDKNGVNLMSGGGTILDAGNYQWAGPGGQDLYGSGLIVRHAYDTYDNGNPKLLISNLNWVNGWPQY